MKYSRTFADHQKVIRPFVELLRKANKNDLPMLLGSFFWLATPDWNESENSQLLRDLFTSGNCRINVKWLLDLPGRVLKLIVRAARFVRPFQPPDSPQLVRGRIARDTEIVIFSWMNRHDLGDALSSKWRGRMWGNLPRDLESSGYKIQFLISPTCRLAKTELESLVASNFIVLNLYSPVRLREILRVLNCTVRLLRSAEPKPNLRLTIDMLLACLAVRTARSLLLFERMKGLLHGSNVRLLLMPWEAQPEQKAIIRACNEHDVRTVGYIHSSLNQSPVNLLDFSEYLSWGPQIDLFLVHGDDICSGLQLIGISKDKIRKIRSLRYEVLQKSPPVSTLYLPYGLRESMKYLEMARTLQLRGITKICKIQPHPANIADTRLMNRIARFPLAQRSQAEIHYVGGCSTIMFELLEQQVGVAMLSSDPHIDYIPQEVYPSVTKESVGANMAKYAIKEGAKGAIIDCEEQNLAIHVLKNEFLI